MMMKTFASPLDRLLPRIAREDCGYASECWVFSGASNIKGYGRIRVDGVLLLTHRFAYEQIVGPISAGFELDHLCRVHACCNPDHLEAVTPEENRRRGKKGILAPTVCPSGHRKEPGRSGRECRACKRVRDARRRAKVVN